MTHAFEKKLTDNQDFRLKGFKVIREDVDSIYLSKQEIEALELLDLSSQPLQEKVRDVFIIGRYTGLRISDLKRLSSQHIKKVQGERYIEIEMKKRKSLSLFC